MTPERSRGLQLYALAAIVLLAGTGWFVRSAPYLGDDPRVVGWRELVNRELPDVQPQVSSDTVVLGPGDEREAGAQVPGGSFTLTMLCAGLGRVRVRLSADRDFDSGKAVPCAEQPNAVAITVGLSTGFYLSMQAETTEAVFRWRLTPATTY